MASASVILVDNGEENLEKCVKSLREQTVPVEIILCPGPKTDLELAKKLADIVMDVDDHIGRSRVNGVLKASSDYIICADSDSLYESHYAENAMFDLNIIRSVKAGTIEPIGKGSFWEWPFMLFYPYEFCLAFRKSAFMEAGIHKEDYSEPKRDVGFFMYKLLPIADFRMKCWTRVPTYHAKLVEQYAPAILGGLIPLGTTIGAITANEMSKTP